MTKFHDLIQPDNGQTATHICVLDKLCFEDWLKSQSSAVRNAAKASKFEGAANDFVILPDDKGDGWSIVAGVADANNLSVWSLAKVAESLPEGTYRLDGRSTDGGTDGGTDRGTDRGTGARAGDAMLGWALGQYQYDEYRSEPKKSGPRILLVTEVSAIAGQILGAEATAMVRDLVNRPAADLGPQHLEEITRQIAKPHKAEITVTSGDGLESGYPLIHAVGKAAAREYQPRLIELEWGDVRHPRIAIIGKGVTFDSGGLDIKTSAGMRIMKKDMGGAAHAIALADLIMKSHLPVRLHLLVAAAENCISGNALRPGDIVRSRKGITVEIDNTDAEGRLVLADAMTKAAEAEPILMVDFATLTGAARVALGPDLPAMFANDDALAAGLMGAAKQCGDPIWQMPLWDGYDEMLASDIADTANSGGGFAGSVTAALFLRKFVPDGMAWAHFDTYAWRPTSKPGRPKGGEALGLRAVFRYLAEIYPVR